MKTKHVLSHTEVADLKLEKGELQKTLDTLDKEHYGKGTIAEQIDRSGIRRQIGKLDQAIGDGMPDRMSGPTRDKLAKEAALLSEEIKRGMPTKDEMIHPQKHPGAIRKNQMWEKNNRQKIERWKMIKRTLEHDDPGASNVEILRSA